MASEIDLVAPVENALTFQSYAAKPRIHDVELRPLRKHRSDNGWFCELLRLSDGRTSMPFEGFEARQLSVSRAAADRINAFHIHPKLPQKELWTVIDGQLLVWLIDCREGSPTADVRQQVLLSAEEPASLLIPPGVAHGYRAGSDGALLVYAMDQQFNIEDPNEGRLPWDHFGAEIWEADRG